VWHVQGVHHGLWDYDFPAAPVLGDIIVDGRRTSAVAQVSKQGFVNVFDRKTGTPVWPIEERAVPQSKMPGERTSPTQPFPTRPPAFDRQGLTDDNLIDDTPELRARAIALLKDFDRGPLFTPPSERPTIQLPDWATELRPRPFRISLDATGPVEMTRRPVDTRHARRCRRWRALWCRQREGTAS
jgi:quinoprotein glucose dehydrogenase